MSKSVTQEKYNHGHMYCTYISKPLIKICNEVLDKQASNTCTFVDLVTHFMMTCVVSYHLNMVINTHDDMPHKLPPQYGNYYS